MNYYEEVLTDAKEEARKAFLECIPTPVAWVMSDLQDNAIGEPDIVDEGDCGGAYIVLSNYRSPFVKYLKENHPDRISKNMGRGYAFSLYGIPEESKGSQSYERAVASAEAFAEVLKGAGVDCWVRRYLT